MKTTIDAGTGRKFPYNEIVHYLGYYVPSRQLKRSAVHLHPTRVLPAMFELLNPGVKQPQRIGREFIYSVRSK